MPNWRIPPGPIPIRAAADCSRDVGFIAPAMAAKVKITAYGYTIYGDLNGKRSVVNCPLRPILKARLH
ncbi:hypothetical protein V474_15415 [Novosphingobium barchaimii LL02]|uniref:Uncharacterized protein n=1 Tax=Novosphingobium barchaimii LL02 TaxID=1114963 RepID=A0A0J7XYA6_9SPHN|nr:hypothetical protein [Novosphingobium barchaimii]KMS56656.1 hypothetical protein V474_15415 [Novosphingobium barchaimii LL02]